MVTTTSNVLTFDQSFYQAMNNRAAKYFREDPQLSWIPQAIVSPLDAPEYKKPIFGNSIGVTGQTKLGIPNQKMETPKSHNVYTLQYVDGLIAYDLNDMMLEGQYLVQRKAQELSTWEDQCKQAVFKGVFTGIPAATGTTTMFDANGAGQGKRLNDGIIEQATLVQDLDGTNSALAAAGDVYKALSKMVSSIPFRYRDGRQVVIGCDDQFAFNARRALYRGATNQISEMDLFLKELSDDGFVQNGQRVAPKLIVSNKLFLNSVAGTTKTETDTTGTHSRLFAAVIDPDIIEQAYSRVGMVGEQQNGLIQSVQQRWAARLAGCVHQASAVVYSEQITWT